MARESPESRQVRLAKNQALFRAVNERVEALTNELGTTGEHTFVCECANPACGSRIELALGEYEAIRRNPTHFVVLPDHVFPDVEVIVDDRARYVVVEKIGAAGEVAAAADERSTADVS
jgi:hypothetical protein